MHLKNSEIISLVGNAALGIRGALSDLHGTHKTLHDKDGSVVRDKDGNVVLEHVPYKFATSTRARLAVLSVTLQPLAQAFEDTRVGLVKDFIAKANGADTGRTEPITSLSPGDRFYSELIDETNVLLNESFEVAGDKSVHIDDLRADENNLPPGLLIALLPILIV